MLLKGTATALLNGGTELLGQTDLRWDELTAWTHAWDTVDATTYVPSAGEQSEFTVTSAPGISAITDRGTGGKNLVRDPAKYGNTYGTTLPLPGPLYIAASARFGGRPAYRCDGPVAHHSNDLWSMLSPISDWTNNTTWLNPTTGIPQPYWTAVLGRGPALCDTILGSTGDGPSFGPGDGSGFGTLGKWCLSCWNLGVHSPPYYVNCFHDANSTLETVLGIAYCDDTSSWVEMTWRWTDGTLHTERTAGRVDASSNYKCPFIGWVDDMGYGSTWGIGTGTPSEADLTAVRSWAARYIPAAGTVAAEP